MAETDIQLIPGRPSRRRFPVSLARGEDVLLTGQVNPYKAEEVEDFVAAAVEKLPGLKPRADELRQELLNLAKPKDGDAAALRPREDHPYVQSKGATYWLRRTLDGDVAVPLMNFTAGITADVVRDDGTERETTFEIEAVLNDRVYTFTVPASRFGAMNWAAENLGAQAIVHPGQSVRDHARAAVQFLSPRPVPRKTIYTHTGWRKPDGDAGEGAGWVYLHGGGAIGAAGPVENVRVDLSGATAGYVLPAPPQGEDLRAAITASLGMLELADDASAFPVLCAVWRAALAPCDFGLHLAGPSGVFKSELAALAQQHFGPGLDARHLPGSWSSTDNALEGLLFAAKDALTVVDDFAPTGGPHDVAKWHQRADRVIRAQGNNSGRGRMRPDGTLRPPKPPRGLVLSTGEEIPRGQSLRARLLICEVSKETVNPDVLTLCQQDARAGRYAAALAGYVRHLAPNYDAVRRNLRADVEALRRDAASGAHCRTPEIVANLALGLRFFIEFARAAGAMTEEQGTKLWHRGWTALQTAALHQAGHQAANEPAGRFVELVTSALASGQAHLADPDGNAPPNPEAWGWRQRKSGTGAYATDEWHPQGARIGWVDEEDVFLESDAAYKAAQAMAGAAGDGLSIAAVTLRKRLDEKGLVVRQTPDELLSRRVLEGRTRRVLHLAGHVLRPGPHIPRISDANPDEGVENGDPCGISMPEDEAAASETPQGEPASGGRFGHTECPAAGRAGNAGKRQGDTPSQELVCSAGDAGRQRGRV